MNNIYDLIVSNEPTEESVSGKVGTLVRKVQDKLELHKKWDSSLKNRVYEVNDIPSKKYKEITDAIHGLQNAANYIEYKVYWAKLCNLTGIEKDHSVIVSYSFKSTKETNHIKIVWNVSKTKITIPNGSKLYHMSQANDIKSLEPTFRGKSAKGYLYSSPRVYFTLKKEIMPKFAADIKTSEEITYYTPNENITSAYIDPLVPNFTLAAVFVETTLPIKVEKVVSKKDKKDIKGKKESVEESVEVIDDEPIFESLVEFMEYYGLEFAEDDIPETIIEESFKDKKDKMKDSVGEMSRKVDNKLFIRKVWDDIKKNIKRETKEVMLSEKDSKNLRKDYETISNSTVYMVYKNAYDAICNFFKIPNKDVIIENIEIDGNKASIRYSKSVPRKIIIPNDCQLLHVSPTNDITELKPTFRSRVKGKYLYPSKRVYFSIRKQVKGSKAGLSGQSNLHRYTPKEDIKTAYIDPSCTDYSTGAIFVDTSFPIPVKNLDKEEKSMVKKESVNEVINEIHSSFEKGLISESDKVELECAILESLLEESGELIEESNPSVLKTHNDILYNKNGFENGTINLCFVTGLSGSGKSTLTRSMNAEKIDMDKVIIYPYKEDEFFKDEPQVVKAFFKGPGKKYRISRKEIHEYGLNKFNKEITEEFVSYVMSYASSHKNQNFILDGAWIFMFIEPSAIKNYAVYIKGTGAFTSVKRAIKRGSNVDKSGDKKKKAAYVMNTIGRVASTTFGGNLQKYINFFNPLYEKQINKKEN